ncbi:hypothetical protein D3C78_1647400 [compost metagenome]
MLIYRLRMVSDGGWLDSTPCIEALGKSASARRSRYREFVGQAIPENKLKLVRDVLQPGQSTSTGRFVDEVEETFFFLAPASSTAPPIISQGSS